MALPTTKTDMCNLSLSRIGAKAVTLAQITADTDPRAQHCNRHYEQTRDSLVRSHWWRFASDRASLTATTDPSFEWDNAFTLPSDFLRMKSVFDPNNTPGNNTRRSFALEGLTLLTNDSSVKIRYIKQVTTVTDFEPLFIEVLVLQLALKLVPPLAGVGTAGQNLLKELKDELRILMSRVRAMDRQETNTIGRADEFTWVDVRATRGGRIDSRLGST